MNKKFWIIAAMFTALCAACNNEVDEIISQPVTDNDWITPDGKVIVQLGAQSYDANASVTRTPLESLIDAEMGIFALNKNGADWTISEDPDYNTLLKNIKGTVPVLDNGENTNASKIALWDTEASDGSEGSVYYYPMNNKNLYSFYGYAPWQSTGVTITSNTANIVFNIDGSQDIIYASTAAPTQTVLTSPDNNNTESIEGYQAKYIRKIKYHNEINDSKASTYPDLPYIPVLNFGHKLTQLKFNIVAATDQCAEDIEKAKLLSVRNINLVGVNTEATLDVIRGELTWKDAATTLPMQFSNAELTNPTVSIEGESKVTGSIAGQNIGYMMLQPGLTEYTLQLTVIPPMPEGNVAQQPKEQTLTLSIKQAEEQIFEAGKSYTVKIALYAMQEVEVEATLTEWDETPEDIVLPVE